jgi:hypothetical protein
MANEDLISEGAITNIPPSDVPRGEKTPGVIRESTRQKIAYIVIIAYIILIFLNIILPMVLFLSFWPKDNSIDLVSIKDLMLAISGVLSGFVGILGFIVGYYFKATEQEKAANESQSKNDTAS